MDLNDYRDEAGDFLRQLGASKQEVTTLVKHMKEDFAQLMDFLTAAFSTRLKWATRLTM
ncbi:MAG: hypothetical protein V3V52_11670 [Candidatus Adiutricales bacterium]